MYFKEKLQVLIGLIENWLSDPEDDVQYKQWHENVKEFIYTLDCSELEELYLDKIVEMYDTQIKRGIKRTHSMMTVQRSTRYIATTQSNSTTHSCMVCTNDYHIICK